MGTRRLPIVLACVVAALLSGCGILDSQEGRRYVVETIGGVRVEASERYNGQPLEIRLTSYPQDMSFSGSVQLVNLGWITIQRASKESFSLDTKGRLGGVESIGFFGLHITPSELTGKFMVAGPTIDSGPVEFKARRVD